MPWDMVLGDIKGNKHLGRKGSSNEAVWGNPRTSMKLQTGRTPSAIWSLCDEPLLSHGLPVT